MKRRFEKSLVAWIAIPAIALGCGPFFPDTMLDNPQAALAVPPVSYLHDLHKLAGTSPKQSAPDPQSAGGLLDQIPLEVAELKALWKMEGVEEKEAERRAERYSEVRMALLKPLIDIGIRGFPTHRDGNVDLPARPLGEDFPIEVADYVEGARLHAAGKTDEARELWKAILDRPLAEKKLRSLWAAWMLAKTSVSEEECIEWYARVEEEARLGGTDVLGLRAAAKSWRAPRLKDPVESIRLLYECFAEGRESAALDLRRATRSLATSKDAELLAKAAADSTVRMLVNLEIHASLDSWGGYRADESYMVRARRYGIENRKRFHYRYDAADLAWEAGKSLPANHPLLAPLYGTAGNWLAPSDPQAADRFYQAIVRRCKDTPLGKAAEEKRWFPADFVSLESMPSLPLEFARDPEREPLW